MRLSLLIMTLVVATPAYAYKIVCEKDGCKEKDPHKVLCDNGSSAGTMYWNGTRWSDGLRWHEQQDPLAKLMVKAQGTACK